MSDFHSITLSDTLFLTRMQFEPEPAALINCHYRGAEPCKEQPRLGIGNSNRMTPYYVTSTLSCGKAN
jgi:hypothetical protein